MVLLPIRALLPLICRRDDGNAAPVSEAVPASSLQRALLMLLFIVSLFVGGAPLGLRGATEGALGAILAARVDLSKHTALGADVVPLRRDNR